MINTSVNYYGKRADMSLYPPKVAGVPQTMGFGIYPAKVIAGPLKAAQNYARVLLSSRGERKEDPDYGTDLISDFASGNLMLPIQITQTFSVNSLRALVYLKTKYQDSTPLDERIKSASLANYTIVSKTIVDFEIELETASKETLLFLLPVSY